jgi:hypothetical protein
LTPIPPTVTDTETPLPPTLTETSTPESNTEVPQP